MTVSVFHDYISQIEDVIEDARNGRFAPEERIKAVFDRYRPK